MTNEQLMTLVRAKKAEIEEKNSRLEGIRAALDSLESLPTLLSLRDFLSAVRALMTDAQ